MEVLWCYMSASADGLHKVVRFGVTVTPQVPASPALQLDGFSGASFRICKWNVTSVAFIDISCPSNCQNVIKLCFESQISPPVCLFQMVASLYEAKAWGLTKSYLNENVHRSLKLKIVIPVQISAKFPVKRDVHPSCFACDGWWQYPEYV